MKTTHPGHFKRYLVYALLSIALGLNFLFLTPTFMPLDVSKWPIGLVFLLCGLSKLTILVFFQNATWLRLSMALSVTLFTFWASAATFDFVRLHQTSLQLPLTYIGLAALGFVLLSEPFVPISAPRPEREE